MTKRRAGRAPEGSGVPVGTEYHWYIVAHQNVKKLNANDYTTSLFGQKFKVAHKRAGNEKWSATPKTQRKRMIAFLRSVIADLEKQSDRADEMVSAREGRAASGRRRAASGRRRAASGRRSARPSRSTRKRATRRRHSRIASSPATSDR